MAEIATKSFSDEETERLRNYYSSIRDGHIYIRTDPGNCFLPSAYELFKHQLKGWKVEDSDVYVLAFVKNGTTWTSEMVWLLVNNCDIQSAKSVPLHDRMQFMEMPALLPNAKNLTQDSIKSIFDKMKGVDRPRILVSHLPFCLLPYDLLDKCKVVMCIRNPKDTLVSYYHHEKMTIYRGFIGDFATYFNCFMDNLVQYSPYFDYVCEAWAKRNHPNMCLLFYEDMKKDLPANIRKVATFLGKEFEDEKMEALVDHLSFEKMKNNNAVNKEDLKGVSFKANHDGKFMRKGQVGDWKNFFTEEMNKRMDEAIEKHFKPIGLEFQYE